MTPNQRTVVKLLRADNRRDLYKASDDMYYVSYSGDEVYRPISRVEKQELVDLGMLKSKWKDVDGFYILSSKGRKASLK